MKPIVTIFVLVLRAAWALGARAATVKPATPANAMYRKCFCKVVPFNCGYAGRRMQSDPVVKFKITRSPDATRCAR